MNRATGREVCLLRIHARTPRYLIFILRAVHRICITNSRTPQLPRYPSESCSMLIIYSTPGKLEKMAAEGVVFAVQ